MVEEIKADSPEVVEIEIPGGGQATTEKPKRKYKPREKKSESKSSSAKKAGVGQNEITMLITGVFSLVALKGGEHWVVTPEEADTISKPLSNILEKMNLVEEVAKVSDGAMLVIACGMLLIPRIIITSEINKSKKVTNKDKIKSELGVKENEKSGSAKEIRQSDNTRAGETATNDINSNKAFYNSIPQ